MKFRIILACTFYCLTSYAQEGDLKPWVDKLVDDETQLICNSAVSRTTLPIEDGKAASGIKDFENCKSYKYYYGIGGGVNYTKARQCAFAEMNQNVDEVFAGKAILMMIYANGYGVAKNSDVAIKLACEFGGAPMEIHGRVRHLMLRNANPVLGDSQFDVCDDITSGYMMGFCADIASEKYEEQALKELNALITKWPTKKQKDFHILSEAADKFINLSAENEVNQQGTARAAMFIDARDTLKKEFRTLVQNVDSSVLPRYSHQDFMKSDRALNLFYRSALKSNPDSEEYYGEVMASGIRRTQKAWLDYRDAWLRFIKIYYPYVSPETIKTILTRQRSNDLENM